MSLVPSPELSPAVESTCPQCGAFPPPPKTFGVLQIDLKNLQPVEPFQPKGRKSHPRFPFSTVPDAVNAVFVCTFNASKFAIEKRRVAILTDSGILILMNVDAAEMPVAGTGLPAAAVGGMSQYDAREMARDANSEIARCSLVPRLWTIVVRDVVAEAGAVHGCESTYGCDPMEAVA